MQFSLSRYVTPRKAKNKTKGQRGREIGKERVNIKREEMKNTKKKKRLHGFPIGINIVFKDTKLSKAESAIFIRAKGRTAQR